MVKISLNPNYRGRTGPSGAPELNLEEWHSIVQQGEKDRKFFVERQSDFFREYPGKLIAVYQEKLAAVGLSNDDIERQLAEKNIPKKLAFIHKMEMKHTSPKL